MLTESSESLAQKINWVWICFKGQGQTRKRGNHPRPKPKESLNTKPSPSPVIFPLLPLPLPPHTHTHPLWPFDGPQLPSRTAKDTQLLGTPDGLTRLRVICDMSRVSQRDFLLADFMGERPFYFSWLQSVLWRAQRKTKVLNQNELVPERQPQSVSCPFLVRAGLLTELDTWCGRGMGGGCGKQWGF